jgi:hypothetical protein
MQPADQTIYHDGQHASFVTLPIIPNQCRAANVWLPGEPSALPLQALCDRLSAERGVKADTSMMSRF